MTPAPREQQGQTRIGGRVPGLVGILAGLLFVITVLYRFGTLGGALGGFDNDHSMQLAYARQVAAGERPLRDFEGVSLQGIWPPLGFELSAAAQELLGDNLRSEALLTTTMLGAGAVATFLAAADLAGPAPALLMTVLSVLLAPKLYAFPKIIVLSAAVLLFGRYARRPAWPWAAALGALCAAALLFRQDYAAYVGAGCVTAFVAASAGGRGSGLGHLLVFALVAGVCLLPSFVFLEQHGGVLAYIAFARDNVAHEASRTARTSWLVASWPPSGGSANAWLFWTFTLLPFAAAVQAIRAWKTAPRWTLALLPTCVMAAFATHFFLRGNIAARFGDVGPVVAVLGAALCVGRPGASPAPAGRAVRALVAALVLLAIVPSVWTVGSVSRELATTGWPAWPFSLVSRTGRVSDEIAQLPARVWTDPQASGAMLAAQYLHACTRPADRVFLLSYTPEVLYFSGRLFGGGVASLVISANTESSDQFVLSRLQHASVPFIVVLPEQLAPLHDPENRYFPAVHRYIGSAYDDVGSIGSGSGAVHILATNRRPASGTFGRTGLPCFR